MPGQIARTMSSSRAVATARAALRGVAIAGTAMTSTLTGYLAIVSVAGSWPRRRPAANATQRVRFAILVPAHDESAVIADTMKAFASLDYDPAMFSVHVVADNCSDDTSDIVRAAGWIAHDRHDTANPGKGPALNWLFDRIDRDPNDGGAEFDVAVIVDADTIVEPGMLRWFDAAFREGAVAAQAYYGVRQPDATPAVALRAAALAARHHLRPLGRTRLGGSCGLYGNGMAFDRALLRNRRWSGHLVEDAEFQIELVLDGHVVAYVPGAVVEAEMPDTLDRSTTQNQRWELGRLQLLRRFAPTLARRAAGGDRVAADTLADLAVPPLSVLMATALGLSAATGIGAVVDRRRYVPLLVANVASVALIIAHVLAALRSVRAAAALYRALASAPRLIAWKLATWIGVIARPDRVGWTRTSRNAEAAQ